MARSNCVIGAITAIGGALIMKESYRLSIAMTTNGPGPGFWPFILGSLMVLVAIILFINTFINREEFSKKLIPLTKSGNIKAYIMMAMTAVYCALFEVLGFYLATVLYLPPIMYLLGMRKPKNFILTTAGILAAIYIIFSILLSTVFPKGILFS
jgi:uncharacterized membrane protein YcgQ (UPF0703/DUF1980 family)